MRIAVMILGILGSLAAGALAGFYLVAQPASEYIFKEITHTTTAQAISEGVDPTNLPPTWTMTTVQEWINGSHWQNLCIWFLLAAFVLGIVGAILGYTGRGFSAAILLFGAFAAPVLVYPGIMTTLVPGFLPLAGFLALFVKPVQSDPAISEPQ